jgi:S1-C subfamily serine protease
MVKIRDLLALLLFSVLLSCITPGERQTAEEDYIDANSYLAEGMKLLELSAPDKFFTLLNTYGNKFEQETEKLISLFSEKQRMLVLYYREKGDLFQMLFHFNNLNSTTELSQTEKDRFYSRFINELELKGYESTARYYRIKYGNHAEARNKAVPMSSLLDYNNILVEINIDRSYTAKYDLTKKDSSFGSGFLISGEHVLTAYHIVEHVFNKDTLEYTIHVQFGEKSFENVELMSWDSLTDIAVLRLPEKVSLAYDVLGLLGDSTKLCQGDEVYCLGHHSGYTSTLTKGIVSARQRKAPEVGTWLQVDANITGGASGGLLLGKDLRIYGMIVAGLLYEDINFIVPSHTILEVVDRLLDNQTINRPWLGVLLEEQKHEKGDIKIIDVFPSSPLNSMGVGENDILYKINGQKIETIEQAQNIINSLQAGNLIHLHIKKPDDEILDFWVLLKRRPEYAVYNATIQFNRISSLYPHFGFRIDENKAHRRTVQILGRNIEIVFYQVVQIKQGSFLDYMGVTVGDYIGFIDDYFRYKTRYIEVIHIPKDIDFNKVEDIFEFIYRMRKEKYDENIL